MIDKCPCYDCKERCLLCHSGCARYHNWVARRKARDKVMRDNKQKTGDADAVLSTQADRIRKRQQAKWQQAHAYRYRKK